MSVLCATTDAAIARALPVLTASTAPGIYDAEHPEVWDKGTEWFVRFPRFAVAIPNFGLVVVTKATGAARWVPLR
ncbi:MAG: hypothetical protein M3081_05385 [Gemmatimonadota bacterium]|nr:hypothetical protein [Gemmatimonadota bacterium]